MENQCKTDPTCINCVHIFNAFLLWSCIGLIFYLCFTSFFSSSVQKTIIQEKTKTNEVLNIIWQNKHGVWEVQLDGITTARLRCLTIRYSRWSLVHKIEAIFNTIIPHQQPIDEKIFCSTFSKHFCKNKKLKVFRKCPLALKL